MYGPFVIMVVSENYTLTDSSLDSFYMSFWETARGKCLGETSWMITSCLKVCFKQILDQTIKKECESGMFSHQGQAKANELVARLG